jgi:hypothetical protein
MMDTMEFQRVVTRGWWGGSKSGFIKRAVRARDILEAISRIPRYREEEEE